MTQPPPSSSALVHATLGALLGAACAAAITAVYLANDFLIPEARPYVIDAILAGAATGGVLATVLMWGPLRSVSLARAVAWAVAGTLFGGIAFTMLDAGGKPPVTMVFGGAVIGCLFATELLRRRSR